MKKLSTLTATTVARKLALGTTTLKLLSGEQLAIAQGGLPYTVRDCFTRYCPPTNTCA